MFWGSEQYLSRFDVVSFDIFDTLLLRRVQKPSDVWLELERRENASGFFNDRKKADAETYAAAIARGGETTLDEAYALIPQWQGMREKELALEREVLYANPEMLEIWNCLGSMGNRRVIISDMYLPGDFIRSVLEDNGIRDWDGFYLSNEHDCRKSSGHLFELMLHEIGCAPEKLLHVGDNEASDIKAARKLGIEGRLYRKGSAWLAFSSYWTGLGYRIGGSLGYMYVSWIVRTAKKLGKTHLMFVGRDGYILQKICNELWPEIKTDYFFAPRIVSIKTLGVIGCDPSALKDRQEYIDTKLKHNNPEVERNKYKVYLSQYAIDEHTAIVDGCSSAFSAQRLVEDTIGHKVFTFYLLAMANVNYGAALYATKSGSLVFQELSEFILCAPTPPVTDIDDSGVVTNNNIGVEEQFKINVSQDICTGALKRAKELFEEKVNMTPTGWMENAHEFMRHLSEEDKLELSQARNARDVQQRRFNAVIWEAYYQGRIWFSIKNHSILSSRHFFYKGRYLSLLLLFKRIPILVKWKRRWNEEVIHG